MNNEINNQIKITYIFTFYRGQTGIIHAIRKFSTMPVRAKISRLEDKFSAEYGAYVFGRLTNTIIK